MDLNLPLSSVCWNIVWLPLIIVQQSHVTLRKTFESVVAFDSIRNDVKSSIVIPDAFYVVGFDLLAYWVISKPMRNELRHYFKVMHIVTAFIPSPTSDRCLHLRKSSTLKTKPTQRSRCHHLSKFKCEIALKWPQLPLDTPVRVSSGSESVRLK